MLARLLAAAATTSLCFGFHLNMVSMPPGSSPKPLQPRAAGTAAPKRLVFGVPVEERSRESTRLLLRARALRAEATDLQARLEAWAPDYLLPKLRPDKVSEGGLFDGTRDRQVAKQMAAAAAATKSATLPVVMSDAEALAKARLSVEKLAAMSDAEVARAYHDCTDEAERNLLMTMRDASAGARSMWPTASPPSDEALEVLRTEVFGIDAFAVHSERNLYVGELPNTTTTC